MNLATVFPTLDKPDDRWQACSHPFAGIGNCAEFQRISDASWRRTPLATGARCPSAPSSLQAGHHILI